MSHGKIGRRPGGLRRVEAYVTALVEVGVQAFGKADVMVNNAGIMPLSPMTELRVQEWEQTIDVNVRGALYGIAAALPAFQKQGSGHFINVSSVAGVHTFPTAAAYCGSKFAVSAITDVLRQEVGPSVRTTVILPGATSTEPGTSIKHQEVADALAGLIALAVPADAIVFAIGQPANLSVSEIVVRPTAHTL